MAAITATTAIPASLVDPARASFNPTLAALPAAQLNYVLATASTKLRKHCRRNFSQCSYTAYVDGGSIPYDVVFLTDFPIIRVDRLATNPTTILRIQNTSTANQRATVAVTSTGLTLTRVASGNVTTDTTVTFAANKTITAVAAAVNALGNGWLATVQPTYDLWPSADFKVTTGAFSAIGGDGAELQQHLEEPAFGGLFSFDGAAFEGMLGGWRLDENRGVIFGRFPRGQLNVRIDYTGGFATVPDPVQDAVILTAVSVIKAGTINPLLRAEKLGDASVEYAAKMIALPQAARDLVSEFVDWAGSRV